MARDRLPRGLRNNNAGNIRNSLTIYMGEVVPSGDKEFKQFKTRAWGYRAVFVLLYTYSKKGLKTIRQMISRYAPPFENNTESYINTVVQRSGIGADEILNVADRNVMIPVVCAISFVENCVAADLAEVREGWELFIKHRP